MSDFTTADTSLCLSLTCRERREVIVENELLCLTDKHLIHFLHIKLGSESYSSQRLCLTTCENSGTVSAWKIADLAPDRTYLSSLTTVETNTLIENHVSHCGLLLIVVISCYHCSLSLLIFLRKGSKEVCLDLLESVSSLLFRLR